MTFHKLENGFCVLRVNARGQRNLATVVGHTAQISAGEWVNATGVWVNERQHGLELKAEHLKAIQPETAEGVERYLGSGMIRGIGPVYARKLMRGFDKRVFELIEQEPERLREITGRGPKRVGRTVAGWAEHDDPRDHAVPAQPRGGTSRALRIPKTYGPKVVRVISEDPYRLARDIRGIGFRTADRSAGRLSIERSATIRGQLHGGGENCL